MSDIADQPTECRPVPPVALSILAEAGRLGGSNGRYEKFLPDLDGLYRDAAAYQAQLAADDGRPVYWVETSRTEDGPGGLITGISVLEPGTVGAEYAMTRGHLHAIADRSELYVGLSGQGVMILETVDGDSEVVEVEPGPGGLRARLLGAPQRQHRHRALRRRCSATPPTPARTTRSSSGPAA